MKYVIKNKIGFPINFDGKIVYFDSEEEANSLIDSTYLVIKKDELIIESIESSKIHNDKFISYKDLLELDNFIWRVKHGTV